MSKTIISQDKVIEVQTRPHKVKKIPNFWVELISFILLLIIFGCLVYLILNFNTIVEFRELN